MAIYNQANEIDITRLAPDLQVKTISDFNWQVNEVFVEVIFEKAGKKYSRMLPIGAISSQALTQAENTLLTQPEFIGSTEI